jgi:hypothetical protein
MVRVERTLLSAAFDVEVDFDVDPKIKTNPKIKSSGQECPLHTAARAKFPATRKNTSLPR